MEFVSTYQPDPDSQPQVPNPPQPAPGFSQHLPPPADYNLTSPLTLGQLEEIALNNNPALAQAAARVRALRGKWVQAGLPPNPTIGYAAEEMGDEGTAGKQGALVGQKWITGGKLTLQQQVVAQEIMRAEQELYAQQQRVRTDVRTRYYDVLIAQRRVQITRDLLDASEKAVEASERLLKAQEIPRIALLQTEVEASNARILRRRADNAGAAAWRRLAAVLGRPHMQQQSLAGDLDHSTAEFDWSAQLSRLITQSPEIAAAVAELDRARRALNRAYAQVRPDVSLQVTVQHDNATGDDVAGVQLTLPVPLWNRNQGGIQQAAHEVTEADRNIQRVELDLHQRLAAEFRHYADSRLQVEIYTTDILPKAKTTFDLVQQGYAQGQIGYLALLTAQRTYFQTNLAYIDALQELWRSTMRIEGLLLEGSLKVAEIPPRD